MIRLPLRSLRPACATLAAALALWTIAPDAARAQDAAGREGNPDAAAVVLVQPLHDGPHLVKPLQSFKSLRTRGMFVQRTDYSCGAAALATVLKAQFGLDVDETAVIRGMLQFSDPEVVRTSGFSLLDMRKYVESLGLRGRGFKVGIERLFDLRVPVITLVEINGYRHFVVVKRAAAGRVFVADPSWGHRTMRLEDFADAWSGILLAVTGPNANPDSVLTRSVEAPVLAQRAQLLQGDIRQGTLDWGFRSLDLF